VPINPIQLLQKAQTAILNAYAPYSNYQVGAALLCDDGIIYTGCNVENASYGLTICAERNAVCAAINEGRNRFKALAIVATGETVPYPCGACRQVLAEFCSPTLPIYITNGNNDPISFASTTLGELLPHSFSL
jgi:cytidine deaminase